MEALSASSTKLLRPTSKLPALNCFDSQSFYGVTKGKCIFIYFVCPYYKTRRSDTTETSLALEQSVPILVNHARDNGSVAPRHVGLYEILVGVPADLNFPIE